MLRQAIYLAEQLLTSCSEYPACLSMAYDELTFIFQAGDTDSRFVEWILDKVSSPFADKYMLQHSELPGIQQDMARKGGIQPVLELCHISDTDDESVMLDLFGHLIHVTDQKRKKSIIPLCSTFNLLQVCERQMNDGSLEGVDALLMCGIILFDLKNMETVLEDWPLDHEELACHLLYTTINWFRETINCFSVVDHDESIHKILIQRLKELSLLEALLNVLLERVPQFTPLELQASSLLEKDTAFTPQLAIKPAITSSAVITSSPLVAQDSDNESTSTTQTAATGTSKRVNAASKQNTPRKLTVDTLRPYLRPIKIQTLVLLESAAREDELRLSVSDINYLLQDIAVKLEAKLGSPMPAFFGKKKANPMDAIMDRDTGTSRMTSRDMMIEVKKNMISRRASRFHRFLFFFFLHIFLVFSDDAVPTQYSPGA
ncbi:Fanconi anaemia protein FANCD2 [Gongronella butleri]|nr:Fanconi anaemia protein FANCD2 [Gongronella butleri]